MDGFPGAEVRERRLTANCVGNVRKPRITG